MISDWTIRLVSVYEEGEWVGDYCTSCYRDDFAADVAQVITEHLEAAAEDDALATWLDEHDLTDVSTVRALWGSWGLETWLARIREEAFPYGFPAHPMISVEYDGSEIDCPECCGDGILEGEDCEECLGTGYVPGAMCCGCGEVV